MTALEAEVARLRGRLEGERIAHEHAIAIINSLPESYWIVTPDLTLVAMSDEFEKAAFVHREDSVGRPLFDVFPDDPDQPTGASALRQALRHVVETKRPNMMPVTKYSLQRPASEGGGFVNRYWRASNHPVLSPDGELLFITHRTEDVTESHEAALALAAANQQIEEQQQALAERAAFLESLIAHVPAAIAYVDRDLVFRMTNPVYDKILGIPHDEIQDRYVFDVFPGTEAQVEPLMRRVIDSGELLEIDDFKFVHQRDGKEVTTYWDFVYKPLVLDPAEGVQGILLLAHDTSKRVEEEQARERYREQEQERQVQSIRIESLEQADKGKDQFLGILSHELRTPINAIMGFGSVLADGLAGDLNPEQAKYVGKVLDSTDALLGMVNDLLDMSRVQAGKFSLELRPIEFVPLLRNVMASLAADAMKRGQSLVTDVPADLPVLIADPQRIRQVLDNLVTNAIKYTPEGGTITVRASVQAGTFRVEVADTGLGVSPGQQRRIFQPFTQVDMTSTRAKGGVGLGLSIVKALVEAHGGEVGVVSEGEGLGSTFFFTLPSAAE